MSSTFSKLKSTTPILESRLVKLSVELPDDPEEFDRQLKFDAELRKQKN